MERTNIRYVTPDQLGEPLDLSVVDVSFISLKLVLPAIRALLKPDCGQVLCLIKPQFEAGKDRVGKKGVVRDPEVHREVLEQFVETAKALSFTILKSHLLAGQGTRGEHRVFGSPEPATRDRQHSAPGGIGLPGA